MNPLESRALRHFVAVAEELSFARAAERLDISAPALSRTVSQLEAQLGVTLLTRSTRSVELTEAGAVLLDQGRIAVAALDAAARRAQRAAGGRHRLVVAFKADLDGGLLEESVTAYEADHPGVPVEVCLCGWGEQHQLLRDGRADVALVYHPHERVDDRELDFDIVLREPQVVVLPAGHPLAARAQLRLADLQDGYERLPGSVLWTPVGRPRPVIGVMSQLLRLIELGQLVGMLPVSVAERFGRPQVAYVPLADGGPARLAVVWPRSSRSLATAAFVRAVADVAARRAPADGSAVAAAARA